MGVLFTDMKVGMNNPNVLLKLGHHKKCNINHEGQRSKVNKHRKPPTISAP